MKLCEYCGVIPVKSVTRRFCSRKCSNTYKNKSEEQKDKVKESWKSDSRRDNHKKTLKKLWNDSEFRKRHSEYHSNRMQALNKTIEFRERVDEARARSFYERWENDPEFRAQRLVMLENYRHSSKNKQNGRERFTPEFLALLERNYLNKADERNRVDIRFLYIICIDNKYIKVGTYMEGNQRRETSVLKNKNAILLNRFKCSLGHPNDITELEYQIAINFQHRRFYTLDFISGGENELYELSSLPEILDFIHNFKTPSSETIERIF